MGFSKGCEFISGNDCLINNFFDFVKDNFKKYFFFSLGKIEVEKYCHRNLGKMIRLRQCHFVSKKAEVVDDSGRRSIKFSADKAELRKVFSVGKK